MSTCIPAYDMHTLHNPTVHNINQSYDIFLTKPNSYPQKNKHKEVLSVFWQNYPLHARLLPIKGLVFRREKKEKPNM